ncbi:MAG TPA: hypothetical protein PLJ27_08610 [Polyangiaceae bacterium]|jgi:predicted GH43/DUF377 family glycosyl hydrolase|nr:MAG: Glycosyl hydrolases family 43 [Deltaproteobacteria bacterium ADurb.Bin207]HNS96087.1 hypothetical protein [Polyangiaceae bacterium]HNZ20909.1 hypothetical protein [Polyangiaceae bacterium]HOD21482.1 hypothetical protein [Polyangiaceae bacterium]HOE47590.1 hypothetical protein [Polyangiaceae bacterium]
MSCRMGLLLLVMFTSPGCASGNDVASAPSPSPKDASIDTEGGMGDGANPSDASTSDAWPGDSPDPDTSEPEGSAPDSSPDTPCVGSCDGKVCADDGCGQPCGTCDQGKICENDTCVCDPALPPGWPASFSPWSHNPVLVPTSSTANHGSDNVYAPDIHDVGGVSVMFYGAQGGDGHDRIYLAWSKDGAEWRKYPSDASPSPVLDRGSSNHVNDPSVVHAGSTWRMYYTDAPTAENDRIWLAEGSSPTKFSKHSEVLSPGPAGSWEANKVGRPSVLLENGEYRMWYDGSGSSGRHIGLATSTDGVNFARFAGNPIFMHAGAIDVKNVGGVYVMLREAGDGTYWATSVNGTCWVDRGKLFGLSGDSYDAFGQVTPFLELKAGKPRAVWFGGASVSSWNRNRVAVAWSSEVKPPSGGGCSACTLWGATCTHACAQAGAGAVGVCAQPGSTNPSACCACSNDGCEGCRGSAKDCHEACVGAGKPGGWCGFPGSTNPSQCCACLD